MAVTNRSPEPTLQQKIIEQIPQVESSAEYTASLDFGSTNQNKGVAAQVHNDYYEPGPLTISKLNSTSGFNQNQLELQEQRNRSGQMSHKIIPDRESQAENVSNSLEKPVT